jgi:phage terminase small subunit
VQAALAVRRTAIEHRTQISQDQVRIELGRVAFFDPRRLFDEATGKLIDIVKLPEEVVAAVSSVEITPNKDGEKVTKVRFCSKVNALDNLCRHLGMYEDKLRILGLERELEAMSDEEVHRRLIELERGDNQ